jgi:hypothetical protein
MSGKAECLTCGTTLVEVGSNLVDGRKINPNELICPACWFRCSECGDWYITGFDCPKHPDAEPETR